MNCINKVKEPEYYHCGDRVETPQKGLGTILECGYVGIGGSYIVALDNPYYCCGYMTSKENYFGCQLKSYMQGDI